MINGIPTYVVIPFKDEPGLTSSILDQLWEQGEYTEILLYDNGSRQSSLDEIGEERLSEDRRVTVISAPDHGIYQMWNDGWNRAISENDNDIFNVAFLNNDITIPPRFLGTLAFHLRLDSDIWITYPDYSRRVSEGVSADLHLRPTNGTYQHGGMCGWAFMLRGEARDLGLPPVDDQFEWWYGDDDMVRNVTSRGKQVCRVVGLPLDHINEATASNGENQWTHGAKERDTQRFRQKWT